MIFLFRTTSDLTQMHGRLSWVLRLEVLVCDALQPIQLVLGSACHEVISMDNNPDPSLVSSMSMDT